MDQLGVAQPALKVVIVDDNVSLTDIYKTRLQMLGYEVHTAYDGKEALYVIEHERPALVLLDLMVPKIAGDQILATMRASDWGKKTKVLIISNLNEADAPKGLREQGIEGYAVKANLSNDALDRLVDDILKPEGQKEDVSLEAQETEAPKIPEPVPPQPAAQGQQAPTASTTQVPAQSTPQAPAQPHPHSHVPKPMAPRTRTPGTPDLNALLGFKPGSAPKKATPPATTSQSEKKPPEDEPPLPIAIPPEQPTAGH